MLLLKAYVATNEHWKILQTLWDTNSHFMFTHVEPGFKAFGDLYIAILAQSFSGQDTQTCLVKINTFKWCIIHTFFSIKISGTWDLKFILSHVFPDEYLNFLRKYWKKYYIRVEIENPDLDEVIHLNNWMGELKIHITGFFISFRRYFNYSLSRLSLCF